MSKSKINAVYPWKLRFYYIEVGLKGVNITGRVSFSIHSLVAHSLLIFVAGEGLSTEELTKVCKYISLNEISNQSQQLFLHLDKLLVSHAYIQLL